MCLKKVWTYLRVGKLLGEVEDILYSPLRVKEWIICVVAVVVMVVLEGWKVHHHQNFHSLDSLHDVSSFLYEKSKQATTLSDPRRCLKDKTASGIFYQLAATFNKSLFTGMLSINLFGENVWPLVPTHICSFISFISVILINSDFENNLISFMQLFMKNI